MSWYLIETLATPDTAPTIVCKDGHPRDWTSLHRLYRDEHVEVSDLLYDIRRQPAPVSTTAPSRDGPRRVEIDPITGPDGAVHGMHVWVGDRQEPVPAHRPAAGVSWNLGELTIRQTLQSWMMSTDDEDGFKRVRSPGEFYRKVVRFDNISDMVTLATDPVPNAPFTSQLTVLHDCGYLMSWQAVGRARNDAQHVGMLALTHDITDTTPPTTGPLEPLGLAAAPDANSPAVALLAFPPHSRIPMILQWVGTPPPWIDWQREGDPELIHHDDWAILRRTLTLLEPSLPGLQVTTCARIRSTSPSGWQPVTIASRRYPGEVGDRLHIIRITPTPQPST